MPGINRKCPACRQPVSADSPECSLCGAKLYILCPFCGHMTLIEGNCSYCRSSQYVICPNRTCRKPQLISPDGRCRNCGEPIPSFIKRN